MTSAFGGINTALTSLHAQRRGLDTTGQNIANANTEGYTRQRVDMQALPGAIGSATWARSNGVGNGVSVHEVQRLRDEQLESRGRAEHATASYLAGQTAVYSAMEDVFNEPNSTALQAQLHDMWGAWSDVANNPADAAARSTLVQRSATVVDGLHGAYEKLAAQWADNRAHLAVYAEEVNTTATAVAKLNDQIVQAKASGAGVNELMDQRDMRLMQLAELTGAASYRRDNGAVDVYVGGQPLVTQFNTRKIEVTGAIALPDAGSDPADAMKISWADNKLPVAPGGAMGSVVDTLTTVIPRFAAALDGVAKTLADTVNAVHTTGYRPDGTTGAPFFSGNSPTDITARNIKLAVAGPEEIAAAGTTVLSEATNTMVGSKDGSVADKLGDFGTSATGADKAYQNMIAELGVTAQMVGRRAEIQLNVTEQVDAARESESGVNLDEEMTNMIKYQRGYEAASRVLTSIDEMLDQLINRTGLVGR